MGGSAFGSNVLLQSREVFAALLCQGNCTFKRGETEGAGIFFAEPLHLSGGLQRVEQVKDVGGAAAANAGNVVQLVFFI